MNKIWVLTYERNPNYKRKGRERLHAKGQLVFQSDQETIAREAYLDTLFDPRWTNVKLESE